MRNFLIDASSAIHAWDEYPIKQFPRLWQWLGEEIEQGNIQTVQPIAKEIGEGAPECYRWFRERRIAIFRINDFIVQKAIFIETKLGIRNDNHNPRGVNINDILLVAAAVIFSSQIMTNEAKQPALPLDKKRYKIPSVCKEHSVPCCNFIEYVKASKQVF